MEVSHEICFNPSRGIAIIQTDAPRRRGTLHPRFNPSRGIAIIQTYRLLLFGRPGAVSIPHAG